MPRRRYFPTHKAQMWQDDNGLWHYRVRARNGRIVSASEQGFKQKRSVTNRLDRDWPDAPVEVL